MSILGDLGSMIGAVSSVGLGLAQVNQNAKEYEFNMANADRNFGLQQQQFDYQKALQQRIFDREDTSLQRRMEDAKAAGLNPYSVLSLGGAGTGSAVSVSAPQHAESAHFNGYSDMLSSILQSMNVIKQVKEAELDLKSKEAAISNQEKEGELIESKIKEQNNTNELFGYNKALAGIALNDAWINSNRNLADFNIDFGTRWGYDYTRDDKGEKIYSLSDILDNVRDDWEYFGRNSPYSKSRAQKYLREEYAWQRAFNENEMYFDLYDDYKKSKQSEYKLKQKEADWYDTSKGTGMADKLLGYVMQGLGMFMNYKTKGLR